MVERILNHGAELIASSVFRSQSRESISIRVESAAVGPHREEQHPGITLFYGVELLVRRVFIRQHHSVCVSPFCVIDVCDRADAFEKSRFVRPSSSGLQPGLSAEPGPAPVALEEVAELKPGLAEKVGEGQITVRAKFSHDLVPVRAQLTLDVRKDDRLRLPIQHDLRPRRKERKALFNLAL